MKKEYIILAIVIIGLGAYLALRSTDRTNYELPRLEALESAKIDRVLVSPGGNDPIELVKRDAQWLLEPQGYLADNTKVQNMLSAAAGLTVTALVSESGNDQRYDLHDESRINVQVFAQGQKIREFDLGRVAPTYQHTFAKLEGNPNIYHVKDAMKNTFDQTIQNLRDKTVLRVDKAAADALEIRKDDHSLRAVKQQAPAGEATAQKSEDGKESGETPKPRWLDDQNRPVDPENLDRLLDMLAELQCETYLGDDAAAGLQNPSWTVVVGQGDIRHTLSIFAAPDRESNERVAATSSASRYAFEFAGYQLDNLEKNLDQLLGITPQEEKKE